MSYKQRLDDAMQYLASKENTIFLGQGMIYGGIAIAESFKNIPIEKKLEAPVAENFQLGISTGLALHGFVPVSVFPRWNFLLLAADQLVNHLDKLSVITDEAFKPKVIIRVATGVRGVIDPQEQHIGDFSESFKLMLKNVEVINLKNEDDILPAYVKAYERADGKSTILVEEHQF
jgi:pyruvate/2-oxoglutarate/acetoin dehydrogenase E1 component